MARIAHRLGIVSVRPVVQAWILAAAVAVAVVVLLLRSGAQPALPTVRSLGMPVPQAALDRTLTIGAKRGVTLAGGSRLQILSRYGQFRGHWWWNRGWVYVSGSVLPGTRIQVHLDDRSLTVSETPGGRALSQLRRFGRYGYLSIIQVDVVRFGIGTQLQSNLSRSGLLSGRQVLDQINARAWTGRGLTITRDHVRSSPANAIPCAALTQQPNGLNLGCQLSGERPLVADRRGRYSATSPALPEADAASLTSTPDPRTQLPTASVRIEW